MDRLYVLTRTGGRPEFFARMQESVRALTGFDVVHIVHTDDPRDTYVQGDIVVQGECYPPTIGTAPYNLYNNRLIKAIPRTVPGWVAFIDDDDYYVSPDVFERLLDGASRDTMHTGAVGRWSDHVWNTEEDKGKRRFQTECFVIWSTLAGRAKWWGNKGGDHYYTFGLTRTIPTQWHDVRIANAQEGKGSGARVDIGGAVMDKSESYRSDEIVSFKFFVNMKSRREIGVIRKLPYSEAYDMEQAGYGRVTYRGVNVIHNADKSAA